MESTCTIDTFLLLRVPLPASNNSYTDSDLQHNVSSPWTDLHSMFEGKLVVEENFIKSTKSGKEIIYWLVAAVGLILIRRVVERHLLKPLGISLGIKERTTRSVTNIPCRDPSAVQYLEKVYKSSSKEVSDEQIFELKKRTELNAREIERWLRKRKALDRTSKLTKFSESGWRFICYVISTSFGFAVHWNKPWFWDIEESWENYPHYVLPAEVLWYHFYGCALYLSFLITQAFDVKRKDFWEMLIHHVITVSLLVIIWDLNLERIGMVTLLLHDCSDVFIESAKMANYSNRDKLATGIFVAFTLVWVITRLIIYPKTIMWGAWSSPNVHLVPLTIQRIVTGLLFFLLGLHLFWTYFILRVAKAALSSNEVKDSRSSSEFSSSDVDDRGEEEKGKNSCACDLDMGNARSRYVTQRRHSIQYEKLVLDEIVATKRAFIKRMSVEWT